MKIGYARVSSSGQHLDVQRTALTDAGCEKIYAEKESGVKERPVLKEQLSFIRQGDTLVVYKLDRLGRSVRELLAMVDDLAVANIHGLLCQLSEKEKNLPVIQKLLGFFGWLDKTAENDTPGTRLIITLKDVIGKEKQI